ncbi:hypothetical protein ARMGADRAFT_1074642 [Armillaria gallica]|uniref:Uncharacterized protein n=1 Tax=Armillaria gallica TaxID=47427 RepID=A0A2H3EHV3_ARMGA|nr:hypothetical protein ARMGADRAFT_1074642 [Armillaria gallica]
MTKPDPFANPHPFQPDDDPFNPRGLDYEWPEFSAPIRVRPGSSDDETLSSDSSGLTLGILGSEWTSTLPLRAAIQSWENTPMPAWPRGYTPIEPKTSTCPTPARGFPTHAPGLPTNRQSSKLTFVPWQSSMRNGPHDRGFRLDEETFRAAIRDNDATLDWGRVGPLPDSPPRRDR